MSNETNRESAIFHGALQFQTYHERTAYVDEACAGDPELRARVEALLRHHPPAEARLEGPPLIKPGAPFDPLDPVPRRARSAPHRRVAVRAVLIVATVLFAVPVLILLKTAVDRKARLAASEELVPNQPANAPPQAEPLPSTDAIPAPADADRADEAAKAEADCLKRLDARACPYNFSARVKTTAGAVYTLSRVQTLSRFPFPDPVKQRFGRLLVTASAPTNTAVQALPAPYQHFWFSSLARLQNVGSRLEISTASGKTFASEWGWLSNYRHKRYPYETRDTHHEILVGLIDDRQVCIDSFDIDEVLFTTDERERRRFESDLENELPGRQPAVLHFENRRVPADRFFILDAAGEWYKTVFFHPWWSGGLDFTIWRDTGQGTANFWEFPQRPISKSEVKKIDFGPAPDWIRAKVALRNGTSLSGYFVTHTESQRGAWQWEQGRAGFWDSIALFTEEGLDVYPMFPGGPHFADVPSAVGSLSSISFGDEKPEDNAK